MGTEKRERQKAARQEKIEELRKAEQRTAAKSRGLLIGGLVALVVIVAAVYSIFFASDSGDDEVAADDPAEAVADGDDPAASDDTAEDPAVDDTVDTPAGDAEPVECPAPDGSSEPRTEFPAAPEMCIDPTKTYTATMVTDAGTIEIDLFAEKAPLTVNNFVYLARYHFYDGLTFHRVIQDFVVQGGDPLGTGSGDPGYRFEDELPDPSEYQAGSLAMANSGPDTNGSQFFIVTSENGAESLVQAVNGEAAYSLFGQVVDGMDVVAAIEADGSAGGGAPAVVHTIESVTITES